MHGSKYSKTVAVIYREGVGSIYLSERYIYMKGFYIKGRIRIFCYTICIYIRQNRMRIDKKTFPHLPHRDAMLIFFSHCGIEDHSFS